MTSTSASGIRRPSIRTVSSSIGRAPGHTSSQNAQPPPRSIPQQLFTDHLPTTSSVRDSSKPIIKRQKLDPSQAAAQAIDLTISDESPEPFGEPPRQSRSGHAKLIAPLEGPESHTRKTGWQDRRTPPFPRALGKLSDGIGRKADDSLKTVAREEVQAKPYSLEIPKTAPRYGNNAPADFFPWTGNHPEDILNENSILNGYYDRRQRSQNEFIGARLSVGSNLKDRSGVPTLSSLFASALDQRHHYGSVTANCTFRPPPRVTLTDTRREAWLRDLANPTIPLRRLSRTIPHGIKGMVLLDHCMMKNIPTWRAVWLAKCVGANELRAFKRKAYNGAFAAGGEAKWIKDWTINVEQFIEALLDIGGTQDWKTRMTYGLQLVNRFYSEHLIDKDQFFEWMLTGFNASEIDTLPIWILIAQSFWQEIWRYRHRGRRLAEAMLGHLQVVNHKDTLSAYEPIRFQLAALLRSCIKSSPDCFVFPNYCSKYEATLQSCSNKRDQHFDRALNDLSMRNAKFKRALNEDDLAASCTIRCRLIRVLDRIPLRFSLPAVSGECLAVVNEHGVLVATVIEWASTRYRNRVDRVYIAVRLLRRWRKQGVSLDNPILIFLGQCSTLAGILRANVSKIVAELVRSSHFSISKYLQWLISRGPGYSANNAHTEDDFPSTLLMELPLHGLPQHVLSLRQMLLKNVGHPATEEKETIQMVKMILSEKLPDLLVNSSLDQLPRRDTESPFPLRGTVKSEIGHWIRQSLVTRLQPRENPLIGQTGAFTSKVLTIPELRLICATLEEYGDFAILADVLSLASNSNDSDLLTTVATVVNRHLDVFWAIGAAQEMFRELLARSANCLDRNSPAILLLLSLVDLGEQLPNASRQIRQLRKRVAIYDSKSSLTACSPVSDHVTGTLQSAEANFVEEMETLSSSGNSMDRQTLSRIFVIITERLEKSWHNDDQTTGDHYALLDQLSAFDREAFAQLILNWLDTIQFIPERPKMLKILAPLVCAGSLQLQTYVERAVSQLDRNKDSTSRVRLAVETLDLVVEKMEEDVDEIDANFRASSNETAPTSLPTDYRYHRAQRQLVYDCPDIIVKLALEVLGSNAHRERREKCQACNLVLGLNFPRVMQAVAIQCPSLGLEIEQQVGEQSAHYPITRLLNLILGLADNTNEVKVINQQFRQLLDIVNDFNTVFCQLKLLTLLDLPSDCQREAEAFTDQVILMLIQKSSTPTKSDSAPWTCLLQKLSHFQALTFHEQAASILFTSTSRFGAVIEDTEKSTTAQKDIIKNLLHSIDVIEHQIPKYASTSIITKLDEKLRKFRSLPSLRTTNVAGSFSHKVPPWDRDEFQDPCMIIDIILRFVVIHLNMLRHPSLSPAIPARILVGLCLLLVHPIFSSHPTISSYIFDTIGFLSDCLSLESRRLCVRALRDQYQIRDARLQFLVGYAGSIDGERLRLVTNAPNTSSNTAGVSPASSRSNTQTATASRPFAIKRWEMIQDATPIIGENDTSLSLSLFGTRKAI